MILSKLKEKTRIKYLRMNQSTGSNELKNNGLQL